MSTVFLRVATDQRPGLSSPSPSPWSYVTSVLLSVVAIAAGAGTLWIPGLLRGTAVMNGSARGTALIVLVIAAPVLAGSMILVRRGAVRPLITWLGAATYILYNSVLFLIATPFNGLFLLYVAMFALSVWAIALLLHELDVPDFARRFTTALPARTLAGFLGTIAVLNAAAWLAQAVPATLSATAPGFLEGTGLITQPSFVQDLSFWLPLTIVTAVWLWQRRPWGLVLSGALFVYGVMEGIGVATDQAFGHAADPASTVVAVAAIPVFLVLAALEMVALCLYLSHLNGGHMR